MSEEKKLDIHEIKRIRYASSEKQVNDCLKNGWYLISAGFTKDECYSDPCCILGSLSEKDD